MRWFVPGEIFSSAKISFLRNFEQPGRGIWPGVLPGGTCQVSSLRRSVGKWWQLKGVLPALVHSPTAAWHRRGWLYLALELRVTKPTVAFASWRPRHGWFVEQVRLISGHCVSVGQRRPSQVNRQPIDMSVCSV